MIHETTDDLDLQFFLHFSLDPYEMCNNECLTEKNFKKNVSFFFQNQLNLNI